jgi:hypothetical protein
MKKKPSPTKAANVGGLVVITALLASCASADSGPNGPLEEDVGTNGKADISVRSPRKLLADCDCVDVGRFAVTGETVRDRFGRHLVWQRRVAVRLSQTDAAHYCASLSLEGLAGFRLPSPRELSGIRYRPGGLFGGGSRAQYCVPSIDQEAFPETPADLFWTSRIEPDGTGWYVGFDDGRMHRDVQSDMLWVRCVHSSQEDVDASEAALSPGP